MRISDWSSDVCSSDLPPLRSRASILRDAADGSKRRDGHRPDSESGLTSLVCEDGCGQRGSFPYFPGQAAEGGADPGSRGPAPRRSEEHTSELQSLMRISYAVFCLNKKNIINPTNKIPLHAHSTNDTTPINTHKTI